jgi:pre-rRNA-processing protein TSR4
MFNSIASPDTGGTITSQGPAHDEESTDSDDENASTSSSASEVAVALASVTLADSLWQSAPSYPPQYLSTTGEYIPPSKQAPDELTAGIDDSVEFNQEGHPWTERYENSMHTDHLFDRFNERAAHEPQQCVRCALLLWRGN